MEEKQAREQENNTEPPGAEKQETPPEEKAEEKKPKSEEGGGTEEEENGEEEAESEAGSDEGKKKTEGEGGEEEKKKAESQVPESKDAYDFKAVLPEHVPENDPVITKFKETFHELGLTQDQGAGMVKFFASFERGQAEERGKMVRGFREAAQGRLGRQVRGEQEKGGKGHGPFRQRAVHGRTQKDRPGPQPRDFEDLAPGGRGHKRGRLCPR